MIFSRQSIVFFISLWTVTSTATYAQQGGSHLHNLHDTSVLPEHLETKMRETLERNRNLRGGGVNDHHHRSDVFQASGQKNTEMDDFSLVSSRQLFTLLPDCRDNLRAGLFDTNAGICEQTIDLESYYQGKGFIT